MLGGLTVGDIVQIASALTLLIGGFFGLKLTFKMLDYRMGKIEESVRNLNVDVKAIAGILINQAVYEQRLLNFENRLSELSHGEGFVLPLHRSPTEVR